MTVMHYHQPVSILARPEGRAQRVPRARDRMRHRRVSILARPEGRAQPGAAAVLPLSGLVVSILARPEGRAQPETARAPPAAARRVSILARPEGRAQHGADRVPTTTYAFNPRPARRPSATSSSARPFQSSPGPKAERNLLAQVLQPVDARVSILARPEGRAQPAPILAPSTSTISFQSSPGPKAERNACLTCNFFALVIVSILARPEGRAQPVRWNADGTSLTCFNPRPARRPSATSLLPAAALRLRGGFQSSPGPKAERNPAKPRFRGFRDLLSPIIRAIVIPRH